VNIDEQIKKYEKKIASLKEQNKIGLNRQIVRQCEIGIVLIRYITQTINQ